MSMPDTDTRADDRGPLGLAAHLVRTPGPWRDCGLVGGARWIVADDGTQIAMGYRGATAVGRANARLIAAAPALPLVG
jgi:hypothetical protein